MVILFISGVGNHSRSNPNWRENACSVSVTVDIRAETYEYLSRGVLYDAVPCVASDGRTIHEEEIGKLWKEAVVAELSSYLGICLTELKKIM
jgi:hypothetical protein